MVVTGEWSKLHADLALYEADQEQQRKAIETAFRDVDEVDRFDFTLIFNSVCLLTRDTAAACRIIEQVKHERAKVLAEFSQRVRSKAEHPSKADQERIGQAEERAQES